MQKNETNEPSVGSSTGNGSRFREKQRLGLGLGGCANHQPFLENLCAQSRVDAATEIQTELKLMLAHIECEANSRTWMHENQATETAYPARPLNVNQTGVQKHFRQFVFLNLQDIYFLFFYVFCIVFLHLFYLRIYDFLCFCIFFLHLLFACIFMTHLFCITCCIFSRFQNPKINPPGADTDFGMKSTMQGNIFLKHNVSSNKVKY